MKELKQLGKMWIFATKVSTKTLHNIESYGRCLRGIPLERKRRKRKKMEKRNEIFCMY
jgi:hypothetical protein